MKTATDLPRADIQVGLIVTLEGHREDLPQAVRQVGILTITPEDHRESSQLTYPGLLYR